MSSNHPLIPDFAILAQRAARRQVLVAAVRRASATGPWFLALCVAAGLLELVDVHVGWWLALAVPLWAIAIGGHAWSRRPSDARALAQWDQAAGRADGFLNAWDFERSRTTAPFALAHLAAMRQLAVTAASRLSADLPLPWSRDAAGRALLAPLACLVLALAGTWSPLAAPPEAQLAADERERFSTTTTALADEAKRLAELAGLSQSEKTSAEDLAKRLAAAKAEAESKGLTAHEALAAMDRLAKDAEKLAEQLADAPAASSALLDELAKHADTAALAEALRSGDLTKAAAAAEALAAKAARTDTSLEEQRRLEEALKAATAAAAAAGDKGAVAKALAEAKEGLAKQRQGQGKELAKQGSQQAGKALSSLAKSLAASATRNQAAKQVQQLAQRLRAGGGKVLASKPGNNPKSNSPVSKQPFTPNAKPSMPTPGAKPGTSQGSKSGKPGSGTCAGGSCPGGSGTPVPGSQPSGGSGAGAGSGTAQTPVPGMGVGLARSGAGRGGTKAGRGHVDRSMAPSAVRPTVDGGIVDAAQGSGDSTSRTVAGSEHGEDSALAANATPAALIDAEERALDAEPLPLARREQVKRYFALLRASADAVDAADAK